jgi:hypothetical protein
MERSGFADLPLHGGRVPLWLAERMTKLGTSLTRAASVKSFFDLRDATPPFMTFLTIHL